MLLDIILKHYIKKSVTYNINTIYAYMYHYLYTHICMHGCENVNRKKYIHIHICICLNTYICIHITHVYTDIYVYILHVYIQIYTYTCILFMYLCTYLYIYSTDINNATFVPCEKHLYDVSAAN